MVNTLIILLAITLLAGLLYFEKNGNQKGKLPSKTILSCLFIFTALVQSHPLPGYFYLLLIGLTFCLGGDIFLALPRERMFLFGLVSFLIGHVFYAGCFFYVAGLSRWTIFAAEAPSGFHADSGYGLHCRDNRHAHRSLDSVL